MPARRTRFAVLALSLALVVACATVSGPLTFATRTPPGPTRTPRPTATLSSPSGTPAPLTLDRIEVLPSDCPAPPAGLPAEGLTELARLDLGFCTYSELDVWSVAGHVYAAQVLGSSTGYPAFALIDVSDETQPTLIGAWQWSLPTYTADIKAFHQGERQYLAVSRQPPEGLPATCAQHGGVAIIDVTDPATPALVTVLTGAAIGSADDWCSVHTSAIGTDASGDAVYLYAAAVDVFDLRVIDLRDLTHPVEVNRYRDPQAGYFDDDHGYFVHDVTLSADRVYVAYWSAGVAILDRAAVEAGQTVQPLNPPDSINPAGLQIHQAYPTRDGQFVFVEDEVNYDGSTSQLRLFDIRNLSQPREVLSLNTSERFGAPHNLLVVGDQLFVGWYQDGVRVFDIDTSDPAAPRVTPAAFFAVRPDRSRHPLYGRDYDGIWGVRVHTCPSGACVYASDMAYGLRVLALTP